MFSTRVKTAIGAGVLAVGTSVVSAPVASACQIDAAWFFLHQCNNPPPAAPLPPDQQQASRANPGGIPWKWWDNAGEHQCPPECL